MQGRSRVQGSRRGQESMGGAWWRAMPRHLLLPPTDPAWRGGKRRRKRSGRWRKRRKWKRRMRMRSLL
jgi:hypothetical protein